MSRNKKKQHLQQNKDHSSPDRNDTKFQSPVSDSKENGSKSEEKSTHPNGPVPYDILNTLAQIAIAIFGFVAIIITSNQGKDSREANKAVIARMDSTMKIENRAYITVDIDVDQKLCFLDRLDTINRYFLTFLNTGKTPAYNVMVSYFCGSDSIGKKSQNKNEISGVVGANQTIFIEGKPNPTIANDQFVSQNKCIFIRGTLFYDDYFHRHDSLNFFYKWMNTPSGVRFRPIAKYNCAN